jgi:hypothetical protein
MIEKIVGLFFTLLIVFSLSLLLIPAVGIIIGVLKNLMR